MANQNLEFGNRLKTFRTLNGLTQGEVAEVLKSKRPEGTVEFDLVRHVNGVCPACGATVPHGTGVPCVQMNCPKCGAKMTRGE